MKHPHSFILLWRLLTTVRNWPIYFLNRFGWMEGKALVRFTLWNGMVIVGRPFSIDRAIINEEWLDRCYEPNDAGIPWDWASCKTILDVGAHIGTFTLYAAAHAPTARIIAFEPEPGNAAILRQNIAENKLEGRVKAVEAAISDHDGTTTFYLTSARSSGGRSLFDHGNEARSITVPLISLESLFTKHSIQTCDMLKMDCEGAEYDVLYSLSSDRLATIRFIAMEYHHFSPQPTHQPGHLKAFLEQHGFHVISPHKSLFFAYRVPAG